MTSIASMVNINPPKTKLSEFVGMVRAGWFSCFHSRDTNIDTVRLGLLSVNSSCRMCIFFCLLPFFGHIFFLLDVIFFHSNLLVPTLFGSLDLSLFRFSLFFLLWDYFYARRVTVFVGSSVCMCVWMYHRREERNQVHWTAQQRNIIIFRNVWKKRRRKKKHQIKNNLKVKDLCILLFLFHLRIKKCFSFSVGGRKRKTIDVPASHVARLHTCAYRWHKSFHHTHSSFL